MGCQGFWRVGETSCFSILHGLFFLIGTEIPLDPEGVCAGHPLLVKSENWKLITKTNRFSTNQSPVCKLERKVRPVS